MALAREESSPLFAGTVAGTLRLIFYLALAMVLNPEVQAKVHSELDAVVGKGMLPTFEDRQQLPYLQATLYEVLRWKPIFPLGL